MKSEKQQATQTIMSILRTIGETTADDLALIGAAIKSYQNEYLTKLKVKKILDRGVRCGFVRKHGRKYTLSDHRYETDVRKKKRAKKRATKTKNAKYTNKAKSEQTPESPETSPETPYQIPYPEDEDEEIDKRVTPELKTPERQRALQLRDQLLRTFRQRRARYAEVVRPKRVVKRGILRGPIDTVASAPNNNSRKIEGYRPRKIDLTSNEE